MYVLLYMAISGHIWWAGESVIRNVLIGNPTKNRPRGRPHQRWLDRVKIFQIPTRQSDRRMQWTGIHGEIRSKRAKGLNGLYSTKK
jgi:hypothetical protein